MKKIISLLTAAAALTLPHAANAALFVSGDSNIFTSESNSNNFTTTAANRRFLLNIVGTNALIQNSGGIFADTVTTEMGSFLTSNGVANTVLASTATITAADLAGRSLFVGYLPNAGYSTSELADLTAYLNAGGSILLTGENSNTAFTTSNAAINSALAAFGSGMRLVPATLDAGYNTATIQTINSATAGTIGFRYAATSSITGGTGLYGASGGVTFLAAEGLSVPEPASWAMMIVGVGLVGSTLRRRSKVSTTVKFA